MTPKEKAKELLNIMSEQTYKIQPYVSANYITEEIGYEAGKKCALIAIDEIIKALSYQIGCNMDELQYYDEVKKEIEKL